MKLLFSAYTIFRVSTWNGDCPEASWPRWPGLRWWGALTRRRPASGAPAHQSPWPARGTHWTQPPTCYSWRCSRFKIFWCVHNMSTTQNFLVTFNFPPNLKISEGSDPYLVDLNPDPWICSWYWPGGRGAGGGALLVLPHHLHDEPKQKILLFIEFLQLITYFC